MTENTSIGQKVIAGTAWMVAARWSIRGIGLVSTIILARLLTPADFGIVAIAMIVVGLVEVFAETGLAQALIRHPSPTREHFDTAWTLQIILGGLLSSSLFLLAPMSAAYFNNPEVELVVKFLAARALIQGFENTGIIWFRRDMEFNKDFKFLVWQKFVRFFLVIGLALLLRDYWALVVGLLASRTIGVVLSFIMHPFRPRLSLSKAGEVWSFSIWMLFVHLGLFLNKKVDEIIIGGITSTSQVGLYHVAADLARSPTQEVVVPMSRVLFSAYSRMASHSDQLAAALLKAFSAVSIIAFATGTGVALVSEDLTLVVLGGQWMPITTALSWIALSAIVFALTSNLSQALTVMGNVKAAAVLSWGRVAFLVPVLVLTAKTGDIGNVGLGRLCVLTALFAPTLYYCSRVAGISVITLASQLWRPILAASLMAIGVLSVEMILEAPSIMRLLVKVSLGASIYTGVILVLWKASGSPDGLETTGLEILAKIRNRLVSQAGR